MMNKRGTQLALIGFLFLSLTAQSCSDGDTDVSCENVPIEFQVTCNPVADGGGQVDNADDETDPDLNTTSDCDLDSSGITVQVCNSELIGVDESAQLRRGSLYTIRTRGGNVSLSGSGLSLK